MHRGKRVGFVWLRDGVSAGWERAVFIRFGVELVGEKKASELGENLAIFGSVLGRVFNFEFLVTWRMITSVSALVSAFSKR